MRAVSNGGKSLPVGKQVVVFTNLPDPVGTEIEVVDTHGNVLNVARVTHVAVNSDSDFTNASTKYVVQALVTQEMSTEKDGAFVTHLYLN